MNTYEQRKPIRRDYYPVKANKGDDSIITIQQRINDGDFLVGGRDRTKRFLEVLSPSFIILGHELIHCLHNQWGINLREVQKSVFNVGKFINSFTNLEEFETIQGLHFSFCENELRRTCLLPLREGHLFIKTTR